jgi:uncharacterized protein (DUF924 family)
MQIARAVHPQMPGAIMAFELSKLESGVLQSWLDEPVTAVTAVILMDAFSRCNRRGTAAAYKHEATAVQWAEHMLVRTEGRRRASM